MLKKLLDWLYDRRTEKILARACDGDLRMRGLAPEMVVKMRSCWRIVRG